jgi:YggT family protein
MILIARLFWFVNWLIIALIVAVILLLGLRLLTNQMNLNPFAWTSLTLRRLTDPLVTPVRSALIRFTVDPKYAPLVTILITILLGWFALQLLSSVANTIAGVLFAVERHALVQLLGYVLYGLLTFYSLLIFIRIVFSWAAVNYRKPLMRFLFNATEPLLGPLRRMIPLVGMFDISPIIAFIIVWLLQAAVAGTLLRGWPVVFLA